MSHIDDDLKPFEYELPKAPKNIMDSWITRLQAVAIVTALLAQVEASFVGGLSDPGENSQASDTALRFFVYAGLILNLGATLSSVLLLLAVTSVPSTSRRLYLTCSHGYPRKVFVHETTNTQTTDDNKPNIYTTVTALAPDTHADIQSLNHFLLKGDTEGNILYAFGVARGWGLMLRHCIFCFLGGCICSFVHVGLALWLNESKLVAAILMPVAFIGFFPPLAMFVVGMESPNCTHCAEERKVLAELSDVLVEKS